MFDFGFNKLNLSYTLESVQILKSYFASIGFKFNIEFEQFDTALFNNIRYKYRYCTIESSPNKPFFMMNYNQITRNKLLEYIAVYQNEYESLIFISFDFI